MVNDIIHRHIKKSLNYTAYEALVEQLYTESKSTGNTQNETYLHYTSLGLQRMKRWNKKGKLTEVAIDKISKITKQQTWLVISEGWCGDAAHALPFLNKIAQTQTLIDLKIVLRDESDELMQHFLTNGGKSIPKLIAVDKDLKTLFTWGPRPKIVTKMVEKEIAMNGSLNQLFKTELQKWFNKDKGESIVNELVELSVK